MVALFKRESEKLIFNSYILLVLNIYQQRLKQRVFVTCSGKEHRYLGGIESFFLFQMCWQTTQEGFKKKKNIGNGEALLSNLITNEFNLMNLDFNFLIAKIKTKI